MDHAYFKDRLSALFDNELPPQEKQVVEEHVHGCAECQTELAKLQHLEEAVTRHSQLADTEYWEKSARKIEQRLGFEQQTVITPIRRKWYEKGTGWKMVAAAASIAVIAYIGINSDKILKREDLEPKPTMQSPNVTPPEPQREATTDSLTVQLRKDIELSPKVEEPKQVLDQQTELDSKSKTAAPILKKTPPAPVEQKDVSLADQPVRKDEEVNLPPPDLKVQSNQYATGRSAAAPAVLSAETSKAVPDTEVGKVEEESAETVIAQLDTAVTDTMLTFWRKKRDALESVQTTLPGIATFDALKKMAPSSLKATEKAEPKLTRQEVEKQLLEAWFNLAKLTDDPDERSNSIAQIKLVAENPKSPNHDLAARYLRQLGSK